MSILSLRQVILMVCCLLFLGSLSSVFADEYIIGPEDVLEISFWQDPQYNQVVTVRQDGKITLSIIGEINAAGLTSRKLADEIERNVSLYNKKISQATVTVVSFNSQKVFVTGQVNGGGKMTFEVIPDLWTVIKEAGGAKETGDLTRVAVIRSEENGGEVITVDVLKAIAEGKIDELPKLKSGDTVEIPKMIGGLPGKQLAVEYSQRKNVYYVLGQVREPGKHEFETDIDIFDALGFAGGLTEKANASDVKIISKNREGTTVLQFDLSEYQSQGQARRISIKPEDTIVIGEKGGKLGWGTLRDAVTIAGSLISFVYLATR